LVLQVFLLGQGVLGKVLQRVQGELGSVAQLEEVLEMASEQQVVVDLVLVYHLIVVARVHYRDRMGWKSSWMGVLVPLQRTCHLHLQHPLVVFSRLSISDHYDHL
jgi:hypothetical protein